MTKLITLVPYNPEWPHMFANESVLIRSHIPQLLDVAHVGSTAVPGLRAKARIDMLLGFPPDYEVSHAITTLADLGYTLSHSSPDWTLRYKPGYNAHLTPYQSDFWYDHLLFRDYLRSHSDSAREYEQLKQTLAAHYGTDLAGYADAKTTFIKAIVATARQSRLNQP